MKKLLIILSVLLLFGCSHIRFSRHVDDNVYGKTKTYGFDIGKNWYYLEFEHVNIDKYIEVSYPLLEKGSHNCRWLTIKENFSYIDKDGDVKKRSVEVILWLTYDDGSFAFEYEGEEDIIYINIFDINWYDENGKDRFDIGPYMDMKE